MTGQEPFDGYGSNHEGYGDSGVIAVGLVNELALDHAYGRPVEVTDAFASILRVLAVDPPSAEQLRDYHVADFTILAKRLRAIFAEIRLGEIDAAAILLNDMLGLYPAHPHLAKERGRWVLHHHPRHATLVPMATAVSAEVLARVVGDGAADRLGTCESDDCDRVFLDGSKNASRRFCSTTCQNRVKAAAFRRRQASAEG